MLDKELLEAIDDVIDDSKELGKTSGHQAHHTERLRLSKQHLIALLEKRMGWIRVEDRLPEADPHQPDTSVFVLAWQKGAENAEIAYYDFHDKQWRTMEVERDIHVDCWQPITPPKGDGHD